VTGVLQPLLSFYSQSKASLQFVGAGSGEGAKPTLGSASCSSSTDAQQPQMGTWMGSGSDDGAQASTLSMPAAGVPLPRWIDIILCVRDCDIHADFGTVGVDVADADTVAPVAFAAACASDGAAAGAGDGSSAAEATNPLVTEADAVASEVAASAIEPDPLFSSAEVAFQRVDVSPSAGLRDGGVSPISIGVRLCDVVVALCCCCVACCAKAHC
jgi:hypothetical protein